MNLDDESLIGALAGARVLIADDDSFMRQFLKRTLTQLGAAAVYTATDGRAALDSIAVHRNTLDLVLLDIDMPDLSGLHVLKDIRTSHDSLVAGLRVVMLTGHSDMRNLRLALTMGIHGFLAKPTTPKLLEKRLSIAMKAERLSLSALEGEHNDNGTKTAD